MVINRLLLAYQSENNYKTILDKQNLNRLLKNKLIDKKPLNLNKKQKKKPEKIED